MRDRRDCVGFRAKQGWKVGPCRRNDYPSDLSGKLKTSSGGKYVRKGVLTGICGSVASTRRLISVATMYGLAHRFEENVARSP